ncbi:MAG: M20 family metallopeptidase [Galactobacter sp.]
MTTPASSPHAPLDPADLQRIRAIVESQADTLFALAKDLYEHPETAWNEVRSSAAVAAPLAEAGFQVSTGVADLPTAFTATAGPEDAATRVGIVAEYDSLPGLGHACGHNLISAAAVGAALGAEPLLQEAGLQLSVIGTPAEEGGGGKIPMIEAGVFDGLDAAMMIHPGPDDRAWAAPFAVAHFDVTYKGKATHAAAYPWLGVNAADAFTVAQVAIGLLRQQLPAGTRVHGIVTGAGTAPNAIPDTATGKWYVRADSLDELETLYQRVVACFEAGATATGCELTIEETSGRYADFITDEELLATFVDASAQLGRDLHPEDRSRTGMNSASTDMGNVSYVVPAIHPYLGIDSAPAVNHQAEFADATMTDAARRAVLDGAVALAATAVSLARARS